MATRKSFFAPAIVMMGFSAVRAGSKASQLWVTTHSARLAEFIERGSGEPGIKLELVSGETGLSGRDRLSMKSERYMVP